MSRMNIEVTEVKMFEAVMRDPVTLVEKYYTTFEDALKAESEGMKLVACRGLIRHN